MAFLDKPKDTDHLELCRAGYIARSVDYKSSFSRPLKTLTATPVVIPVYFGVNDDLGEIDHLDLASELYFLLYDTEIDLMFLTGGSKTTRYGMDFSRNFGSNLDVHGEFSLISDCKRTTIDSGGNKLRKRYSATNYLIGLRYPTQKDTAFIKGYYHNGTGCTPKELRDYFTFIDNAYKTYTSGRDKTF